jgi:hypothetical protein
VRDQSAISSAHWTRFAKQTLSDVQAETLDPSWWVVVRTSGRRQREMIVVPELRIGGLRSGDDHACGSFRELMACEEDEF